MTDIDTLVNSLEAKQAERAQLVSQVAMWARVKTQGIDLDAVDRFGFDSKLLTLVQRIAIRKAARMGKPDPFTGRREQHSTYCGSITHYYSGNKGLKGFIPPIYNYVLLKDGTRVTLDPMVKAP